MVYLVEFPSELLLNIFSFLTPYESYGKLSLVCKRWHILLTDKQLWHLYYERNIGGMLHTHIPTQYNIYLDSYKWVFSCLTNSSIIEKLSFSATFGHSKLFKSLLLTSKVNPLSFQDPVFTKKARYHRNIIQAATDLGFDEIVTCCISACMECDDNEQAITTLCFTPDDLGYNTLHIASMKGRTTIIKYILKACNNLDLLNIKTSECKIEDK